MTYVDDAIKSQVKAEVASAFEKLAEAAKALDSNTYFSLFDKQQFTSLNHDGTVVHEFADFKDAYENQTAGVERYLSLEFSNVKITVPKSDIAVLINEYSAELQSKSGETIQAKGAGTQVWSKSSGHWLLIHVASSSGN